MQQVTMVHCHKHVLDSAESVHRLVRESSDTSFHLNKWQCQILDEELAKTKAFLLERSHSLTVDGGARCISLEHLCSTVKRAEVLVRKCCCKDFKSWLVATLMSVEIQEECIAIVLDLHLWRMLLDWAITSGKAEEMRIMDERYHRLLKDLSLESHSLRQATIKDKKETILNSSRIAKMHGSSAGVDSLRASYMQSWLLGEACTREVELQDYKYKGLLGRGACGVVMKVKWLGFECALKILGGKDVKEANALRGLFHPNIIRLLHYWEDRSEDPRSHLLMELMPRDLGGYMREKMRRESSSKSQEGNLDSMPFSLPVAIDIMYQIAQAMRYMHDQRLAHRDLKPSNILVRERPKVGLHCNDGVGYLDIKLADFGLVKAYTNTSTFQAHSGSKGTAHYRAPEMFEKDASKKIHYLQMADVWSFGITCVEILIGKEAYATHVAEYGFAIQTMIRKEGLRPTLPEDCPEYLWFCIKSCWELLPTRRPTFSNLCKLLRHAKLLSLGVTHLDDSKFLFAYLTRSDQVNSLSLLPPSSSASISALGNGDIARSIVCIENPTQVVQPLPSPSRHEQQNQASLDCKISPLDASSSILPINIPLQKVALGRTKLKAGHDGVGNLNEQHSKEKNKKVGGFLSTLEGWLKGRSAEPELPWSGKAASQSPTSHLVHLQDDDSGPSPDALRMAVKELERALPPFADHLIETLTTHWIKFSIVNGGGNSDWALINQRILVQGFLCRRLFDKFDAPNGVLGIKYSKGAQISKEISWADYCRFKDKAATVSMLLESDSPDGSFLGRFCFKKFLSIFNNLADELLIREELRAVHRRSHPKTPLYRLFLDVAVSVWLLHRLVHSFEEKVDLLIHQEGSQCDNRTMRFAAPCASGDRGYFEVKDVAWSRDTAVEFSVIPGFQVSGSVVVKNLVRWRGRPLQRSVGVKYPVRWMRSPSP